MDYPNGAIKSFAELYDTRVVFGASKKFHTVDSAASSISLTISHIHDYNVPKLNGYNDWFLFAKETDAKAWAVIEQEKLCL